MATVDYFERKLDDKRRLTIPAELRAEFASGAVVTRGFQTVPAPVTRKMYGTRKSNRT